MAVGLSSSQSLRVQVGARYRDQDPGSASSLGRCLLAPGMSYLTHRAAPLNLLRAWGGISKARAPPLTRKGADGPFDPVHFNEGGQTGLLRRDNRLGSPLLPTFVNEWFQGPSALGGVEGRSPRLAYFVSSPSAISSARLAIRLSFRPSF
jgi:hypothetical protein